MVHALARPLARRGVQPGRRHAVSRSGWPAWSLVLADVGGRWWTAAGVRPRLSGALCDTLDGCVAVLEDRTTRWGYVLDSAVDRVSDAAYLVAAVAAGLPGCRSPRRCGFGFFFLEYLRARAGNAGGDEVGGVTVAERPDPRARCCRRPCSLSGVVLGWRTCCRWPGRCCCSR